MSRFDWTTGPGIVRLNGERTTLGDSLKFAYDRLKKTDPKVAEDLCMAVWIIREAEQHRLYCDGMEEDDDET